MRTITYIFLIVEALFSSSCFHLGQHQLDQIRGKSPSQWTEDDCKTVIAAAMVHNLYDVEANVFVYVTPYTPLVITAHNTKEYRVKDLSENEFRENVEREAKEYLGMSYDWKTNQYVDSRGDYYESVLQLDSLIFLITLENIKYPQEQPVIDDLEGRITLQNDSGDFIRPLYIKGRKQQRLVTRESIMAMFRLRTGSFNFLEGAKDIFLNIGGFDKPIKVKIPLLPGE